MSRGTINRTKTALAIAVRVVAGITATSWMAQASAQSLVLEEVVVSPPRSVPRACKMSRLP